MSLSLEHLNSRKQRLKEQREGMHVLARLQREVEARFSWFGPVRNKRGKIVGLVCKQHKGKNSLLPLYFFPLGKPLLILILSPLPLCMHLEGLYSLCSCDSQ